MRIPFDNKSHKIARNVARRAKESARASYLRCDDVPRDASVTKRATRRTRRALGVCFVALLALGVAHSPAMAWGSHSGTTSARATTPRHHSAKSGSGSATSARASLRAYYAGGSK